MGWFRLIRAKVITDAVPEQFERRFEAITIDGRVDPTTLSGVVIKRRAMSHMTIRPSKRSSASGACQICELYAHKDASVGGRSHLLVEPTDLG